MIIVLTILIWARFVGLSIRDVPKEQENELKFSFRLLGMVLMKSSGM